MRRASLLALTLALPAAAASANVAALQAALYGRGLYARHASTGCAGPATTRAVRRLQRRRASWPTASPGRGRGGARPRGAPSVRQPRALHAGSVGWDVAALQFLLERHGFPCGGVDGGFGARTVAAVQRLQALLGLPVAGYAGPATRAALRRAPARSPLRLARPVAAAVGDRYGPRGNGWHAGLDFPAATGTPVAAAGRGRVVFAGWDDGFGLTVVVAHGLGVHSRYAHLSRASVSVGADRRRPARSSAASARRGHATGPHLHFEVSVRGANVDPALALGGA